jgi:predicted RNA methylase
MQPVKSLSQGSRKDANIANLGYWPTDRNTIEAISKLLVVQPETDVQLFDCSCGKFDALAPVANALNAMGATTSLWGIELHDERFQTAHNYLSARGIPGSVLHADAISPDVSVSENWASVSIFNPPYGEQKHEREGQTVTVRLERIFWTKHIARTKRGTGITVAILPTQLFRADPNLTRMIGRHFVQGRVFRAETDDFNQVVIIGYRQKANLATSSIDKSYLQVWCMSLS